MSNSRSGSNAGTCRETEEKTKTPEEIKHDLQTENDKLKKEKQDLLSRLSKLAGVQMTENNPNVTDLSDIYRPINLGEEFSEIYDNEYTDVLVLLKDKNDVKKIQNDLLKTAEICHKYCEDWEKKQFKEILGVFHLPNVNITDRESLPKGVIKHVKELRTSLLQKTEIDLEKEFFKHLKTQPMQSSLLICDDVCVKKFIRKCLSFFWRACIQTPPLYFDFNVKQGTPFDNAVHRKCTANGPMVTYTVWPVAYLHENGPLLLKGVVQCEKQEKTPKEGVKSEESKGVVQCEKQEKTPKEGVKAEVSKGVVPGHTGQTSSPGRANQNRVHKSQGTDHSLASKSEFSSREEKRQKCNDQK